jgi:hypothetical protein
MAPRRLTPTGQNTTASTQSISSVIEQSQSPLKRYRRICLMHIKASRLAEQLITLVRNQPEVHFQPDRKRVERITEKATSVLTVRIPMHITNQTTVLQRILKSDKLGKSSQDVNTSLGKILKRIRIMDQVVIHIV